MSRLAGCSGTGLPKPGYLESLDFFEVKDTFFLAPKSKTLQGWRERAGADFVFAIRAWQVITHESDSPGYRVMPDGLREAMKNGGHFKACGEVRDAWQQTVRAAESLRARAIVFETPSSFTPTSQNRLRIKTFFESIERPPRTLLVWEPLGIWSREEQLAIARDLDLVAAMDEDQPQSAPTGYLRLHRGGYDEDRLLSIADSTWEAEEMYYAFQSPNSVHHARRLQSLLNEATEE